MGFKCSIFGHKAEPFVNGMFFKCSRCGVVGMGVFRDPLDEHNGSPFLDRLAKISWEDEVNFDEQTKEKIKRLKQL